MNNPLSREAFAKWLAEDFDPSPIYYGDDYTPAPSYEDWLDLMMDELGLY